MIYQRNLKWIPYHSIVPFICNNKKFRFRSPLSSSTPTVIVYLKLSFLEFLFQGLLLSDRSPPDSYLDNRHKKSRRPMHIITFLIVASENFARRKKRFFLFRLLIRLAVFFADFWPIEHQNFSSFAQILEFLIAYLR